MTDSILEAGLDNLLKDYKGDANSKKILQTLIQQQYKYKISKDIISREADPSYEPLLTVDESVQLALDTYSELIPTLQGWVGVQPAQWFTANPFRLQIENTDVTGTGERRMSLNLVKTPVVVEDKDNHASFMEPTKEDIELHGDDLRNEIIKAIASETVVQELQHTLSDLKKLADPDNSVQVTPVTCIQHVALLISKYANQIGIASRRGAGNFVVVSPTVLSALQIDDSSTFARTTEPESRLHVGTLHGTIKVYMNAYNFDDSILIGYKGSSEVDTGYIYSPFVGFVEKDTVTEDDKTRQPFITRAGRRSFDNCPFEVSNSKNYYRLIKLDMSQIDPAAST